MIRIYSKIWGRSPFIPPPKKISGYLPLGVNLCILEIWHPLNLFSLLALGYYFSFAWFTPLSRDVSHTCCQGQSSIQFISDCFELGFSFSNYIFGIESPIYVTILTSYLLHANLESKICHVSPCYGSFSVV